MNNGCYGNKTVRFCSRDGTNMATGSDDLSLEKGFLLTLTEWGKETGRTSIELAVLGRAGIGKSSLINGIIGMELAKEGADFDPVTKENHDIRVEKNGIEVILWDTPGLGSDDPEVSHQRLKEMRSESQCIDLLLYCIKMDEMRWPGYDEKCAIINITGTFGKQIWQNCQFTLTFGNEAAKNTSDKGKQIKEFKKRVEEFTNRIRKTIQKHAGLTNEEAAKLPVVPVGDPHKKSTDKKFCRDLPGGDDWFIKLFLSCISTMQKEAVGPFLRVRMSNDNSINPQDVHDLHSAYPMATRMDETEDRSLDLDKENDPESHAPLEENHPPHEGFVDHLAKQQVKQQVDVGVALDDHAVDEGTLEDNHTHVDQQVGKGKLEEHTTSETGKADKHLNQQADNDQDDTHLNQQADNVQDNTHLNQQADNDQDDTHHDDQELHQRKLSYREIHAQLKKEVQASLMQCIYKYKQGRERKFQVYAEGFLAWLETKYHMQF